MRGQAIVEFVIFIGVALLIAATFIMIASEQTERTSQARHQISVNEELERLQSEFIAAAIAKDGYEHTVTISPRNAVALTVRIDGEWITAHSARYSNTIRIPETNASMELSSGTLTIRTINETVFVT
jgi:archaellum component FlaG (FlaF/FlaG flagellin family)